MKKDFLKVSLLCAVFFITASCSKNDDPGPGPGNGDYVELSGNLSTQTLTADKKYLLVGQVFVRDGQTLTIEPGTVICGQKSSKGVLVIDRGGKIMAEGTVSNPIVFTSNQDLGDRDKGDWGGVVVLGKAPVNQTNPTIEGISPAVNFGGDDPNDNSGILKYVRIEFAGIELTPNNETNSLTMGGVGKGTVIENVMVSYGGDDGFEWFGGNVDGKNLISFAMWDDDFDVDYGFSGMVQFGLAVRYTSYADQSESNGFETDNGPNDNDVTPYTDGVFSNITIIGPISTGTSISNTNFAQAIDLRRRTALSIFNSVFAGFPKGVRMNQPSVLENYVTKKIGFIENNVFHFPATTFLGGTGVDVSAVGAYITANNEIVTGEASAEAHEALGLKQSWFFAKTQLNTEYPENPDFTVASGTIASGADFSHTKLEGFEEVSFRGAFGSTDWTDGWANFRPKATTY